MKNKIIQILFRKKIIIITLISNIIINCLNIFNISLAAEDPVVANNFANRKEVKEFMQYMHTKHNFNIQKLENLFKNYTSNKYVLDKISNPSENLAWKKYKQLLITNDRIIKGKIFLNKYRNILLKAEQQFMVPKEIIVAILGVESFYGERAGNIPVVESLATLSFDYPPRKNFFKKELEQFLLLIKEEKLDPNKIMGSYAGAMSPAQFISTSYRNYAIDFANIGSKDLNNMHNAIGSVANYLSKHGWSPNKPIAIAADVAIDLKNNSSNKHKEYLSYINQDLSGPKCKYLLKKMLKLGLKPKNYNKMSKNWLDQQVSLMEFKGDGQPKEYWLGFNNFYVITRYNHSINYAMVIYQLAVNLGLKL